MDSGYPASEPISNPNPDLRWEEKHETNLGLDFALFKSRISGTLDFYLRRTNGLLYNYSVPTPPNLFGTTQANVGIMENKGIELLINAAPYQSSTLVWNTSINGSTNANKLVSLSNDLYKTTNDFFYAGGTGEPVQTFTHRVKVGEAIGNFYGYKVIDVTDDGRWVYEDKDGKPTTEKGERPTRRCWATVCPSTTWRSTTAYATKT